MMVCSVAFCAWGERPAACWGGSSRCAPAAAVEILFPAPKEARGEAEGRRRGKKLLPVGAIFSLKKPVFLFL